MYVNRTKAIVFNCDNCGTKFVYASDDANLDTAMNTAGMEGWRFFDNVLPSIIPERDDLPLDESGYVALCRACSDRYMGKERAPRELAIELVVAYGWLVEKLADRKERTSARR